MTGRPPNEPGGRRVSRLLRTRLPALSLVGLLLASGVARASSIPLTPAVLAAAGSFQASPDVSQECLVDAGKAIGAALLWAGCVTTAAVSAGVTLVPCFALGIGAFFLALEAAQECIEECPTCSGGEGDDDEEDDLPDCDDPDLEEGDECYCTCPGEPCCGWP